MVMTTLVALLLLLLICVDHRLSYRNGCMLDPSLILSLAGELALELVNSHSHPHLSVTQIQSTLGEWVKKTEQGDGLDARSRILASLLTLWSFLLVLLSSPFLLSPPFLSSPLLSSPLPVLSCISSLCSIVILIECRLGCCGWCEWSNSCSCSCSYSKPTNDKIEFNGGGRVGERERESECDTPTHARTREVAFPTESVQLHETSQVK